MSRHDEEVGRDEGGIEELLREVGARGEPAPDVMNEVRQAVHGEWRVMLEERSRRRRTIVYGMAASVAFAVIVATAALRFIAPEAPMVATIASVAGPARLDSADSSAHHVGETLAAGTVLRTDGDSRIALDFGAGVSVRIDHESEVLLTAPDRMELRAGAVYVDAGPREESREQLVVETRAGAVRHLGTQYQVRQTQRAVEISIREGQIEIAGAQGAAVGSAGEQLLVRGDGSIERSTIAPNHAAWRWATQAAPVFDIENQSLATFLIWVARETGRTLVYATSEAQNTAEAVRLRGSIAGLDPDAALGAVLSTTELTRYATGDEVIGVAVARAAGAKAE